MGGVNCNKLQVLEMSEENGFSWTVKADLPASRVGAASVVHEGMLWVIGGLTNWANSNTVAIYDIDADSWGTGPALPRAASCARATTLNGEVYVVSHVGSWIHRNAAWVDIPGGPEVREPTCAGVLL